MACSFSASATRDFQPASLRDTRPARITGRFAFESSFAAASTSFESGMTGNGAANRFTSGSAGIESIFASWRAESRLT